MHELVPASVLEALPHETAQRFEEAFEHLRAARRRLHEQRPGVAIEQLIDDLGLLAGAAHPPDVAEGSLRAGRVLRTMTYVQDLAAQGLGWAEVLDELQRVVDGEEEVDGMTLETGGDDAVRVMNVHQAKGLEAPVVFLADPYSRSSGPSVRRHLRREAGELVAPIVQGSGYRERVTHPPLGWERPVDGRDESFRESEERHEAAEERRLLYVAATRAQNLLVVSTYPEKPDDGPWAPLYPHLDAADVLELGRPDAEPSSDRPEAPAPALTTKRAEREAQLEAQSRPSYRTESVTDGDRAAPVRSSPASEGYGEAFGSAIHQLLEQCVRTGRPIPWTDESVAASVLERTGVANTPDAVERATTMVQRFLDSRVWGRVQAADRVYAEYPIAHAVRRETPVVRRGVIDLAWRADGRWTLVDHKTDRVQGRPPETLSPDHAYVRQLQAYARAWAAVVNEPVAEVGLWLADAGTHLFGEPTGEEQSLSLGRRAAD
jgi:ATP-dependent exoDNAse (exonuclease V) beta subunit (contains helicase and exonuclease domains)